MRVSKKEEVLSERASKVDLVVNFGVGGLYVGKQLDDIGRGKW